MMRSKFPHITLIANKDNVGFATANNQAVALAKGEYVCILNPDTAVTENCFVRLLSYAEKHKDMGALGTYLMDGTGNFLPESKRNLPTPLVALKKILGVRQSKNGYYAGHISEKEKGEVSILVGAFMLLKRDVYNQVGGFDEDYFMYGEDIDFSYSIEKTGLKNHYFGAVSTLHYKGESTVRDKTYLKRFYGAMHIFYEKQLNLSSWQKLLVKGGVLSARLLYPLKKAVSKREVQLINNTLVFTDDISLLSLLSEIYEKSLPSSLFSDQINTSLTNTEIIFDADYMSYEAIFKTMQQMSNKGNCFKIKPPGCNFLLGSNQSDCKGSVVKF
ncbi:b-glycosyltransferase, glycosyltransferase family 2 protein [unidentified eubacterium SCB49]|nr:b-glycosyltransferase, glycosyltransferase family 2 protein [unidentified eubacterium SCB49]